MRYKEASRWYPLWSHHINVKDVNRCQSTAVADDILPHIVQCVGRRGHVGECEDSNGFLMHIFKHRERRKEVLRGFRR